MDCALARFIYFCHVVHGSKSAVEFLCLGFPIYCHKWDISMVFVPDAVTKIVKSLGLFWSFCLFVCFLFSCFSTLPVQFLCVERGCVGQLWDYTQPHINEKSYFTSRNSWGNILHFTRIWLLGTMSVNYFTQILFRCYTKHGVMSNLFCNGVAERVRCLLSVWSLSEIHLTLLICGFFPQTMEMGHHGRSADKKRK